jgi:hypothetical protein
VDKWPHLGHIICNDLYDKIDIMQCRNALVGQINNVLCYFCKVNSTVKNTLLYAYCYSLYGSVLWNLEHSCIDSVCSAWKSGQRRVWGLPLNAHSSLLPLISSAIPIQDELAKRFVSFAHRCLSSEWELVKFVASHAIRFNQMNSHLGVMSCTVVPDIRLFVITF